jgi:hypothetical protein
MNKVNVTILLSALLVFGFSNNAFAYTDNHESKQWRYQVNNSNHGQKYKRNHRRNDQRQQKHQQRHRQNHQHYRNHNEQPTRYYRRHRDHLYNEIILNLPGILFYLSH